MPSILRDPSSWFVDKLEKEEHIMNNKLLVLHMDTTEEKINGGKTVVCLKSVPHVLK